MRTQPARVASDNVSMFRHKVSRRMEQRDVSAKFGAEGLGAGYGSQGSAHPGSARRNFPGNFPQVGNLWNGAN